MEEKEKKYLRFKNRKIFELKNGVNLYMKMSYSSKKLWKFKKMNAIKKSNNFKF